MIVSTLARKVFDQTGFEQNINNIMFVEDILQRYQINGVVAMIKKSKYKDPFHIERLTPMYKFSKRKSGVFIGNHLFLMNYMQMLCSDFPWNYWEKLVTIGPNDLLLFHEAINIAVRNGKNNLPYVWAIFTGKKQEIENRQIEIKNMIIKEMDIDVKVSIPADVVGEWDRMKEIIQ